MRTMAAGTRSEFAPSVLSLMHKFRHEIFIERLGWTLPSSQGSEADQYDDEDARYVVMHDADGAISGCARLRATTNSYMLPELFPQLLGSMSAPHDPDTWELSRFAVSVRDTVNSQVLALSGATMQLLESVFCVARAHNVSRLVLVTSIAIERIMLRSRVNAHRVAPPARVNGNWCVALIIEVPHPSDVMWMPSTALPN